LPSHHEGDEKTIITASPLTESNIPLDAAFLPIAPPTPVDQITARRQGRAMSAGGTGA